MAFWLRWRRRPISRPDLCLVMYTRRGCHLCETAWECLRAEQRRWQFILTAVDVDTDPALVQRHGDQVPVVTVNGIVRFRGGVNRVLLARLLSAPVPRKEREDPT